MVIPCLEITAAVMSVRTSYYLQQELEIEEVKEVFWTKSKVDIAYITNETRKFHVFVANRLQQIKDRTSSDQGHCGYQAQQNG